MKKRVLILFLCIATMMSFAACGESTKAVEVSMTELGKVVYEDDAVTVKFMGVNFDDQGEDLDGLKVYFQKEVKGEDVEMELAGEECEIMDYKPESVTCYKLLSYSNDGDTKSYLGETIKLSLRANDVVTPLNIKLAGTKEDAANAIKITSFGVETDILNMNDFTMSFSNLSEKEIKRIHFTPKSYNKFNEELDSDLIGSFYADGPFAKGDNGPFTWSTLEDEIASAKIVDFYIEYMDGSVLSFNDEMLDAIR